MSNGSPGDGFGIHVYDLDRDEDKFALRRTLEAAFGRRFAKNARWSKRFVLIPVIGELQRELRRGQYGLEWFELADHAAVLEKVAWVGAWCGRHRLPMPALHCAPSVAEALDRAA